jgi:hypothetical protein
MLGAKCVIDDSKIFLGVPSQQGKDSSAPPVFKCGIIFLSQSLLVNLKNQT